MPHLEFYHFDTTNQWNPSFQQIFNKSNDNPFNLTFQLPNQINKVKRIGRATQIKNWVEFICTISWLANRKLKD